MQGTKNNKVERKQNNKKLLNCSPTWRSMSFASNVVDFRCLAKEQAKVATCLRKKYHEQIDTERENNKV